MSTDQDIVKTLLEICKCAYATGLVLSATYGACVGATKWEEWRKRRLALVSPAGVHGDAMLNTTIDGAYLGLYVACSAFFPAANFALFPVTVPLMYLTSTEAKK